MPVFEETPEASADSIEGVDRIKITNALADGDNYRLTSNFAGNEGRIPGVANRCRI
jgi:hypothetical protein